MKTAEVNVSAFADFDGHECVMECTDSKSGLQAYIAIHNRNLGPALGGCRIWPYASREEAITDVLRLSRGMTYKSAMAKLPLGGGKAVIIADPKKDKTREMLLAMGDFVESLEGRYITAEDSGTSVHDLEVMAERTSHVTGIGKRKRKDGSELSADPSPATAYGVFTGIRESVRHRLGKESLEDIRVAIQGVGNVGKRVAAYLVEAGARVYVADIYRDAVDALVDTLAVTPVELSEIHRCPVDVFAPCALGGIVTTDVVGQINATIIAGSANNQLASPEVGRLLVDRGILYAPDYVINAGGIIDICYDRSGEMHDEVVRHIDGIADTLNEIYRKADAEGRPTQEVADEIAEARFRKESGRKNVA